MISSKCWKGVLAAALILAEVCLAAQKREELLVSAAISLKNAFEEIGSIHKKQTGIQVHFNFGSSGLLQQQIDAGAPVDIFASAGEKQMDDLQTKGFVIAETRRNFTRNDLVLVVPAHSKVSIRSFRDLTKREVMRLAIGSPKTVPAGQYAQDTLKNLGLWDAVQSRLVQAENVRQVLDYVSRGEADAGFVYASDLVGMHKDVIIAAHAPEGSHAPILYPIAVVKDAGNRKGAQSFIDLALSKTGQAILKKYGFLGLH
jgi:molybdate transport system substrate-binding protein